MMKKCLSPQLFFNLEIFLFGVKVTLFSYKEFCGLFAHSNLVFVFLSFPKIEILYNDKMFKIRLESKQNLEI